MIPRPVIRPAASLLLACAAMLGAPVPASSATLAERLASLAARTGDVLRYEEQRKSILLDRIVAYRGRLIWDPQTERLTKWVDEPSSARLTITADALEAETASGRTRRLPLSQRPELAALLGGVRALMSGDTAVLMETFRVGYEEGEGDAWVMNLVPSHESLPQGLARLVIRGTGEQVEAIEMVLENGERQHMRILAEHVGQDNGEQGPDAGREAPDDRHDGTNAP